MKRTRLIATIIGFALAAAVLAACPVRADGVPLGTKQALEDWPKVQAMLAEMRKTQATSVPGLAGLAAPAGKSATSTGIGFTLPPGARSTCGSPRCDPGFPVIDQSVTLDTSTTARAHDTFNARYCGGHETSYGSCDISTGNTQHSTDILSNLVDVCTWEPSWFAANGYGNVSGVNCVPSMTEIYDGYFTQGPSGAGYKMFRKAVELRLAHGGQVGSTGPTGPTGSTGPTGPQGCNHDGKYQLGETCANCPGDFPPGTCPVSPPPPPATPDFCNEAGAKCRQAPPPCQICPACAPQATVAPIPKWILDQCAAEKPPANKVAKTAKWNEKCGGVTRSPGYVVREPSTARLDLVLLTGCAP